ncbi:hypothetical protein PIB30_030581 [Stylosanthes scabra]|uniref:Uncharacterized protein n=1 Tax=Stylosanthes scabra TaxID=79078 RepID=A0ABU6UB07_9FABA|nr:hypothetical protein [Stylosanthes scabra]
MGCTASKLDNEETVRRCKDRRRLMKEAVLARHHLAAAHSDYCRSLRHIGDALCTFAAGEPLSVSDNTPAVFINPTTTKTTPKPQPPPQPPQAQPPPQPPSPSATITSSKLPHILTPRTTTPAITTTTKRRRKPPPKLPHILSESSMCSSPRSQSSNFPDTFFPTAYSTYSTSPSQASSVWNWDNFYPPPSPPGSEYFRSKNQNQNQNLNQNRNIPNHASETLDSEDSESESLGSESEYNYFHSEPQQKLKRANSVRSQQQSQLERSEYGYLRRKPEARLEPDPCNRFREEFTAAEREEVQCSDWGDRYSDGSSSEEGDELRSSVRADSVSGGGGSGKTPVPPAAVVAGKVDEKRRVGEGGETTSESYRSAAAEAEAEAVGVKKVVVRHKDLKEIVEAIRDYFEKAASAGDQLSEMLEISKEQLDRSFKQLRKTVYHSTSLFSNLSSNWTSKPPLVVKYRLDPNSLAEPGGSKSLCSTLERLLAWEKKLYQEVKAREGVKIEHEKKLSALQSRECKGGDEAKIDKTKASITRLQSLIIVTSQAVSTTSTAINGLRDSDLVPQLVELCHGVMYMWKSMHQYHEIQSNIVQQVRGLVNQSSRGHSTSELHRQATRDLESTVTAWHASFCRLVKFQRDFILSLHGWFKLNLIPVNNDNKTTEPSDVFTFCDEWKLALDRVPDTVASEAIKSFINVVHVIYVKQSEELKSKKRTDVASKELEKKSSSLRNIEKKFYNSYSTVGISIPNSLPDGGPGLDARDPLAEKKQELAACQRHVEDEMVRHSKAVEVTRAMTLNNLQTGLPGVFQALSSFSSLFTEILESVCTRSYAIK